MSAQDWQKVEELLHQAMALAPEQRAEFLDRACGADAQLRAFGHAWAELQIEGRWVVADAALADMGNTVRYLPFGVLENEGMGYALDMARLTPVWVQRVEVLGSPSAETVPN